MHANSRQRPIVALAGPSFRSSDEIDAIARAARLIDRVLLALVDAASPGVTTAELDALARCMLHEAGATPAFEGQRDPNGSPGFPGAISACINDQAVHAPPNTMPLRAGDLLTIDAGARLRGWFADAAVSFVIGDPNAPPSRCPPRGHTSEPHRIAAGAHAVLAAGISLLTPGIRWSLVARAMEAHAADLGLGIVTEFVGHGIGRQLHERPKAPAWWNDDEFEDFELAPGLVLAIEPIVTATPGRTATILDPNGWTVRTRDRALAAHAEAMVAFEPGNGTVRLLAGGWIPGEPGSAPESG